MKNHFTAIYEKKGKWVIAYVEEIPGVNTQGKTLAEAKRNLKEALELVLESNRMLARSEIHSSKNVIRESIAVNQ
ncbi:MAG TPA: HicB family protein [Deltaproteobacteria bacterium]|nr:MAG: hypothetical protein A2048_10355 [Deltaproteobacteria bacterium GWA2_45_12]HBF13031.1 HicB family protein [Deltaproteobacteria bacterium]